MSKRNFRVTAVIRRKTRALVKKYDAFVSEMEKQGSEVPDAIHSRREKLKKAFQLK